MSFMTFLVKPLAYLSLPVLLLRTASNNSQMVRYYVRLCLYLSALGLCSAWGAIVSIGMTLVGRRFDINWVVARSFYALAGRALGIRFEVEGEEYLERRPAVLVGNHQSMLDILFLGRILPKRSSMTSKKELQWTPLLGQFMTLSGAVFIDRGNNVNALKSIAAAGQAMQTRRTSVWVFPEGTRSNKAQPDLLAFKKGAFHLAVQAGVPITPVVCENYWRLYHQGVLESGELRIRVLPPVPTTGLSAADVPELAKTVREQMLTALLDISRKPTETAVSEIEKPSFPLTAQPLSSPASSNLGDIRDTQAEEIAPAPSAASAILIHNTTQRREGSDKGAETEEDEGMVLVGRPT